MKMKKKEDSTKINIIQSNCMNKLLNKNNSFNNKNHDNNKIN